ncbi:MAG: maltose/maltodextrin ABC transporter substrate-binding protein MalE [Spartobacteria bacterium]|nr:maltose/maltodextrin ABC transporter substrate-binding protein MalE [Spartobacteria bacterium]
MKLGKSILAAAAVVSLAIPAYAVTDGELLIWINGDKAYDALQEIGNKFEEDTGIPVTVQHPDKLTDKFGPAAQAGRGPDVVMWAHDRLGGWAQSGLLKPIDFDDAYKAKFDQKAWDAVTFDGKTWGYPLNMECITLIYNKALIKDVPKTLEDVVKLQKTVYGPKDQYAMLWAYDTPYFSWPFLAGAGAYVFGRNAEGEYNVNDIGVNAPGAISALDMIGGMIKEGDMPRSLTYDVMMSKMQQGECAMIVNGPWCWNDIEKSGVDFGLGVIPGYNGPGKPFVGVLCAMVDANTPNAQLVDMFFRDYVLTTESIEKMNEDKFGGAPALIAAYEAMKSDPRVNVIMENVQLGNLMANIPQMGTFWGALDSAIKTVTAGTVDAKTALDNAEKVMASKN